jgi:hypothetical protein
MNTNHPDVEVLSVEEPEVKLPKGKQPRNWQDRNKYSPHQNNRECLRRANQALSGRLKMDGAEALVAQFNNECADWLDSTPEDWQDPPAAEEV